jgi:hypothetical protein
MKKRLLAGLVALALAGPAQAILIDQAGDTGVLNGVLGGNAVVIGVPGDILQGVGNSKTFLTNQGDGTEAGYNTTGTTEFQTTASGTTALSLSQIPNVLNGGQRFLEFAFTLNQTGASNTSDITRILIFQTNNDAVTGFNDNVATNLINIGGQTNLIFGWSAALSGQTLTVQDFVSGQSNIEMLLLVPAADFQAGFSNVIMYVQQANSNDGPDKWIVFGQSACVEVGSCTSVPEPMSMALVGLGLLGMGWARKRK